MTGQTISVVIPTLGRPSLTRAVESALNQDGATVEVVVAVDGDGEQARAVRTRLPAECVVVWTGGAGVNAARNAGIRATSAGWVALLDDDDAWLPHKTSVQLSMVGDRAADVLLTSAIRTVPGSGPGQVRPRRPPRPGEPAAEYLFRRRTLGDFHNVLQTSTWLAPRRLFLENQFNEAVRRHTDWDWLVTTQARHPFEIRLAPEPLVLYTVLGADSISRSISAQESRAWIRSVSRCMSRAAYVDFLLTAPIQLSITDGGPRLAWHAFRQALPEVRPQNALAAVSAVFRIARSARRR